MFKDAEEMVQSDASGEMKKRPETFTNVEELDGFVGKKK